MQTRGFGKWIWPQLVQRAAIMAMSEISEANDPVDWATGESRTRIRNPSVDCSM